MISELARIRVRLSDAALRQAFPAPVLEAGRLYELRGRVHDLRVSSDGGVVSARTIGSAPDPYRQQVRLRDGGIGQVQILGGCTCAEARNCKHVAAVAVAAQRWQAARGFDELPPAAPGRGSRRKKAEDPLPPPADPWLGDVDADAADIPDDTAESARNRILYAIGRDCSRPGVPALTIQPFNATLRKDGRLSHIKQYPVGLAGNPPRFLRPSDRAILTRLGRRAAGAPGAGKGDDDMAETLRRMLGSGRAYWQQIDGKPLAEGPARPGRIEWEVTAEGAQRAVLALDGDLLPVRIPSPWYVDPAKGVAGPVSVDLPDSLAAKLLAASSIPADAAARVREELARRVPGSAEPAPNAAPAPRARGGAPKPILRLMTGAVPAFDGGKPWARAGAAALQALPLARLSFDYAGVPVPSADAAPRRSAARGGAACDVARDPGAEAKAVDALAAIGFGRISRLTPDAYRHAHSDDFVLMDQDQDADWLQVMLDEIPRLRDLGWTIEIDDDFPIRVVRPDAPRADLSRSGAAGIASGAAASDGGFDAELVETSGIDWLELHVGAMVDGERVDLVPHLIDLILRPDARARIEDLSETAKVTVPLPDGRLLALPLAKLRPTLTALLELHESGALNPTEDGRIGFSRLNAIDLAQAAERGGAAWKGGERLRELGAMLRASGGEIPCALVPMTFKGKLRGYQARGVDWLQFLRGAGLGGVLADDMGLGKTVQTLAHLAIEKAAGRLDGPALIVCPTSLIPNWTAEAAKFAPDLRVLALHGLTRKSRFREIAKHDIVLTTYPLLARDYEVLTAQDWSAVVLDEAQTIKNPNAATTRQALRLKARQRLCLSGTPLQNHLGELWSLFDFLAPGFLGDRRAFQARYRNPIEKLGDAERSEMLAKRVRPFLLRRTKEEVAPELPPKTEIVDRIELESGQQAIYEGIRMAMHARVKDAIRAKGLARSGIVILDALLKMRQICCDPRLLKMEAAAKSKAGSAKLDRLMEMVEVMLAEGRRILLFSQFTEMLALIEERVREAGIEYAMLTGDTKDRASPVRRFQAQEAPLFLISLKAGGVGLNLTAADTVIHYDPWWNPAAEDQATDRAHRIGQEKRVFVHRLVTMGTIEEKMEALKEKKRALVASVMEAEHGGALKWTEADVEALFAPA